MPHPFILVTTSSINDGKLEHVKALSTRFAERVQDAGTGLLAFHFYLNDDGTEVSNVQVHRDAASMDAYLPLAQPLIQEALSVTKTLSIDVYGTPGPVAQQVLQANAEQGARVLVSSDRIAGFAAAA